MTIIAPLLLFVLSTPATASGATSAEPSLKREIRSTQRKVDRTRDAIKELRKSLKVMTDVKDDIERDLVAAEAEYAQKFSDVLSPLLAWPKMSMNSRVTTWSEREHGQMILDSTREALVKESILLVAERDLELKRAVQLEESYATRLKDLGFKQKVLKLQLEELKLLQRRQVSTRR